ncbi:hypothetical protein M426DRAFT_14991 [Hypoxylon sp. CI-4A]|nr:hypothetical protein M426DRAFT_14991 [Hypoxylon sp. CI-4A]
MATEPEESEYEDRLTVSKFDQIVESPNDSSGPITFGIELEFISAIVQYAIDPHPWESRTPIRAETSGDIDWVDIDHQMREILEGVSGLEFRLLPEDVYHDPQRKVVVYDKWRLIDDSSVYIDPDAPDDILRDYFWVGREVTSPIMRCDQPDLNAKMVTDACRAIRSTRVHLNNTAGVHIHVGRGSQSFSLLTMKKASTLFYLVDDMLLNLQHPSRQDNCFCYPIRDSARFAQEQFLEGLEPDDTPLSDEQAEQAENFLPDAPMTELMQRASKGIDELAGLMTHGLRSEWIRGSISLKRFFPAGDKGGNSHTFEFRQMAASLDPKAIMHWARVCTSLVDFARLADGDTYKALIEKIMEEGSTFSAFDLLSELNLGEEERYYKSKAEEYESGKLDLYEGQGMNCWFVPPLE